MKSRNDRIHRRGFLLIEMIVILTITAIAVGATSYLAIQVLRTSQAQADSLVQDRALHLWAEQFRQDSRAAIHVQIDAQGSGVEFELPDQRVTYRPSENSLERRVNQKLAGRWMTRGTWSFSYLEGSRIVRAELTSPEDLSRTTGPVPGTRGIPSFMRYRIDAAVGRTP